MSFFRASLLGVVTTAALSLGSASPQVSSLAQSPVTIYGAKWCGPCKILEKGLDARKVAYDVVDVDDNPSAFERARAASGEGGAIPLTSIVRTSNTVWVVGADIDAVERATHD